VQLGKARLNNFINLGDLSLLYTQDAFQMVIQDAAALRPLARWLMRDLRKSEIALGIWKLLSLLLRL
jgi:hypothetical protein